MNTANQVTAFNFNTSSIRVVTLEGNPWFVGVDIPEALGYSAANLRYHMHHNIDASERGIVRLSTLRGMQGVGIISESGLYKLIMRSGKPQAKAFQNWVTKEVLPSIRKTGSFVTGQPSLVENPQMSALEVMMAQAQHLPKAKKFLGPPTGSLLPAFSHHLCNVAKDRARQRRAVF